VIWDFVSIHFEDALGMYTVTGERAIVISTLRADMEQAQRLRDKYAARATELEARLQAVQTRSEVREPTP
jgi:hypothetical protein